MVVGVYIYIYKGVGVSILIIVELSGHSYPSSNPV